MDVQNLEKHNPWWLKAELVDKDSHILEFNQRQYQWQPEVITDRELDQDGVLVIRGPRRIGKTTYLKRLIRSLLISKQVKPLSVFYFACDIIADYKELLELLNAYLDYARPRVLDRLYLLIDEISLCQRVAKSRQVPI